MDMSVKLNSVYPATSVPTPANALDKAQPARLGGGRTPPTLEPERAELEKAVTDIREFVQASQRKLDFSIDDSTGRVVVKVIATESGEVIRQIPSETLLKLAHSLNDASSWLFDTNA